MNSKIILALDPSGNFTEGKGTTGWCLLDQETMNILDASSISAKTFDSREAYWKANVELIKQYSEVYKDRLIVVIEDYILYANKASNQINSKLETSRLLGILQYICYDCKIHYTTQLAASVKNRWTNEILEHKGIINHIPNKGYSTSSQVKLNRHSLDAVRHAVHYATFTKE